jgi:HlyD family secretion protein
MTGRSSVFQSTQANAAGASMDVRSAKLPITVGLLCVLAVVGGFGGWASVTHIAGAVVAHARVEVESQRQIVQHPDGGVVAEILVEEGDSVASGDVLVRLDDAELRSSLAVVEGQLLELLARRARLEAEERGADTIVFDSLLLESENPIAADLIAGSEQLFAARRDSLARQVEGVERRREQTRDQIVGIEAQSASAVAQASLVAEELGAQVSLRDRGLTQASRVLELEREAARLSGQSGELLAAKAEAEGRGTELEIEVLRIEAERRSEASAALRDLSYSQIELTEKHAALVEQLGQLEIRAPVSGIIYGMTVFAPRSVIRSAEPVLFLVPQDRPLVVAAHVLPTDVDQVHVGQEVRLKLSSFDQRHTPEVVGRVTQVSPDAFEEEATRSSYYRVEVQIEPGEAERLPDGVEILPGMPVEAFIATGSRTPLDYLLHPLTSYFAKAFRET